ncbi:hypothetical protein B0H14DRAFT_2585606 [Mycena olivaceomarginata]|nr:hypothetical protein B0H14DRAFT_2585606 [Mycena olivaceomarginata]
MAPTSLHPTPAAHHLRHPAHGRPTLHISIFKFLAHETGVFYPFCPNSYIPGPQPFHSSEASLVPLYLLLCVLLPFACLVTHFRLYIRFSRGKLWWDDFWAFMATLCAIVFVAAAMLHVQDPGVLSFSTPLFGKENSAATCSSLLRGLMCGADARAASWCEGVASWVVGAGCSSGVFSTVLPPFLLFVFSSFGEEYLHLQGVAHRDIKPENLFFDTMGHLKVGGFEYSLGGGWREWKGEPGAVHERWSGNENVREGGHCTADRPFHPSPPFSPSSTSLSPPPSLLDNTLTHTLTSLRRVPRRHLGVRDRVLLPAHSCGELSEIVQYLLHMRATRKTASGLLPILTVRKCAAPTPDLRQHLLAYREPDCTDPLTWSTAITHPGTSGAGLRRLRLRAQCLLICYAQFQHRVKVDSDNTSSKIGCSVPTPVACTVSPDLVDSNNTSWKIVGSVPTAVARTVSPDLVDSDNTSWKILHNPVVQARAENVDSDNKSWEIAANNSWTTRSTKVRLSPLITHW